MIEADSTKVAADPLDPKTQKLALHSHRTAEKLRAAEPRLGAQIVQFRARKPVEIVSLIAQHFCQLNEPARNTGIDAFLKTRQ